MESSWLDTMVWQNPVKNYLVACGLMLAGLILGTLFAALLRRWVIRGAQTTDTRFDDVAAGVGHRLVLVLVFLAGLHAAFRVLQLPGWLTEVLWELFVIIWTIIAALFLSRFLNGLLKHYVKRHAQREDSLLDEQLLPILKTVVNIGVWVIAALFALANLGFNIGSILAGLGLGGLALAMGAKDLVANVFGSFTILVQGPFRVGDAVSYQGYSGKVERLGLRSTEIRTYDGHLVVVPNSLATTSVVENISRRPAFRVLTKLPLSMKNSPQQCGQATQIIRRVIEDQEGVRANPLVHFLEYAEDALQFQILYYIEDQDRILDIRHKINIAIKTGLEEAGILLHTHSIIVDKPIPPLPTELPSDTNNK